MRHPFFLLSRPDIWKTFRFYFPALSQKIILPICRRTHPGRVCIHQSACLKAHTRLKTGGTASWNASRTWPTMSARIGAAQQALCYFYRNPPPSSGVRPQPYKRDRQANRAATTTSRIDPDYCAQVPLGPTGARQEEGMAQDDRRRGCQDLGALPEETLISGLPGLSVRHRVLGDGDAHLL